MRAHRVDADHVAFHCPGCASAHMVRVSADGWTFNGDFERPTISPSVLVTGTQPITDEEHETLMKGGSIETRPLRCHSFVTDGRATFLGDSLHALAGQTVELPDWESLSESD